MKPKIIRKPSTHSSKNGVPSSLGADRQGERIMAETNSGAAAAIESLDPRIRYTLHDGVATITIAQPEKRNAVAPPMWDALTAHFTRCSSDPEVRAVIFRSEEHTSELQSLMRISYAVLCLKKNK